MSSVRIFLLLNHSKIMMKERKIFQPLTSENICEIYKLLNREGFISFSLNKESVSKTESLVYNITNAHFGVEPYISDEEKAVAYLYFLIKNHPFVDGNKRTAVLSFEVICRVNNLNPNYGDFTLDQLAIYIEQTKTSDHQDFIKTVTFLLFNLNK